MPTVQENGSECLKINEAAYNRIQNQQKCAFYLNVDFYIYGEMLHQLITKNPQHNPLNILSGIYVGEKPELLPVIKKFFDEPKLIAYSDHSETYGHKGGIDTFYFIPHFEPHTINEDFGFTIDQIYYHPKTNRAIDASERGLNDISLSRIIVKSTASSDKWDDDTLSHFVHKIGFFYNSEIDLEDRKKLRNIQFEKLPELDRILKLNRPGSGLRVLCEIISEARITLFDSLISFLSQKNVKIGENIQPSQVFIEEKFKLLDLYSDYFNSSGSPAEKKNKDRILAKLLVDT